MIAAAVDALQVFSPQTDTRAHTHTRGEREKLSPALLLRFDIVAFPQKEIEKEKEE